MSPRYVILDRDGTINLDSDAFIKTADEWQPISGSLEAIAEFNRHGYKVVIITNQSGIGRGLFDLAALDAMHAKMQGMLASLGGQIEAIYFCPHGPNEGCICRKPKPGLFEAFAKQQQLSLDKVYSIGDSYRDIQASIAAGAKPVLVKTGKGLITLQKHPQLELPVFENLYDAARHIISKG